VTGSGPSGKTRIVLVPGVLALLPEYASATDPITELRSACLAAVGWLGTGVEVVADESGAKIARALLDASPPAGSASRSVLVVANGSACRTEKAPGYLDPRAEIFDADLGRALAEPDSKALREVDDRLAKELWASTAALPDLADLVEDAETVAVDYDAAPYGVQYWVMRWESRNGRTR
jgi:hypothetical protein